ncbi:MAG: N-acetyl-gamma-glutamyl-phosphate reductase [Nitrospirae bacterium]|nr:N-acetyl-gamma-glutamyl-phosphate reductase [Nitrospirota bacterium]
MLKTAIIGGSGYTGGELLRLLLYHTEVEISAITSEKSVGNVAQLFPNLKEKTDLCFEKNNPALISKKADFIFLCLPHCAAMDSAKAYLKHGKKVVDLSADFRLKDYKVYEKWYKEKHTAKALLKDAVYGLPELYRDKIKKAVLVANPGCYPTSAILAIAPLLKSKWAKGVDLPIIIDSKSGVSGAGRGAEAAYLFTEANESVRAYKIGTHRHTPEIEQELSKAANKNIRVSFTPHLIPMNRGILSTIYIKKAINAELLLDHYKNFYENEPFVRVLDSGALPDTKNVRGSNICEIGIVEDKRIGMTVIVSAIDNLVKGASGQAIQNMHIMQGCEEGCGLNLLPIFP